MSDAPGPDPLDGAPARDLDDVELGLLLEAVYRCCHHDFRDYARASLRRRLRLALTQLGAGSLSQLQDRLFRDGRFCPTLLGYLTVPTTEMFRDPGYFRALRQHVVPFLQTFPSPKIWIAGCSTGEEAWSVAIVLAESKLLGRTTVYATDISTRSLETARAGIYPADRVAEYSRSYVEAGGTGSLSDWYTAAYGAVRFDPRLREQIVFADHSLATDAAFSEVEFVSCRNVLIYFERPLQERAFRLFTEALRPRGYLGLGRQESLRFSAVAAQYEEVVREERLYRKAAAHA